MRRYIGAGASAPAGSGREMGARPYLRVHLLIRGSKLTHISNSKKPPKTGTSPIQTSVFQRPAASSQSEMADTASRIFRAIITAAVSQASTRTQAALANEP